VSHYGRSKLRGEGAVRGSPLASRTVIVRPPVVYGPRDTDVLQVFRAAAKGLIFTIGRQESYFSFVYVSDLVDGLLRAAAAESAGGKTYFLASLLPVTWAEFGRIAASAAGAQASRIPVPVWAAQAAGAVAERLARLTGKPGILSRDKIREARHRFWTCSPALAMHDLGFRARTSLQDGIAATYAWYKDAGWLN
ncbi:MAG: sugar nucleotide-binding protein, partial [Candidatus Solibacter usitatus]|nr:sugar nucleotide-binding protein [Candidatus Solibacter usitatus]